MHRGAVGRSRVERVRQVEEGEESVFDFSTYVPIGQSHRKARSWHAQGAEIVYLSSHRTAKDLEKDRRVLIEHQFPEGEICFRQPGQDYADITVKVMPDILIEDDCESIGGEAEMTYPQIPAKLQQSITHIIVKEFEGIDHLPDDLDELAAHGR